MNSKNYCFIFIVTGALCLSAFGQIEFERPADELLLIAKPCPALAGIDKLHVIVLRSDSEPNVDGLDWEELRKKVTDKIGEAGIEQVETDAGGCLDAQELRVYVNLLEMADSGQYVFFIRTALARAVRLSDIQVPLFKADVWQAAPAMRVVSSENISDEITNVVLGQADVFIHARQAASSLDILPVETQDVEPVLSSESEKTVIGKYVASKNSSVFHKPDCGSAKKISQDNLVIYDSRDEAIKAGKRPCKSCNP